MSDPSSSSGSLNQTLTLDVVSKARPLAGLEAAHTKLLAISSALDAVNHRLNGLTNHAQFSRSEGFLKDFVKQFPKGHSLLDIGKQLGYDVKALEAQFQNAQHAVESGVEKLKNKLAKTPVKGSGGLHKQIAGELAEAKRELERFRDAFTFDKRSGSYGVSNVAAAARFFGDYQKGVLQKGREPMEMLQKLFASEPPTRTGTSAAVKGESISLVVPPSQIVATLGPGTIPLVIPASQVVGAGAVGAGSGGGAVPITSGTGTGRLAETMSAGSSGGPGSVIERRQINYEDGRPSLLSEKERLSAGKTITRISKLVDGILQPVADQTIDNAAKGMREKTMRRVNSAKLELERASADLASSPEKLAEALKKSASRLESILGGHEGGSLEGLGLGQTVDQIKLGAARLRSRAKRIEAQVAKEKQKRDDALEKSQWQYTEHMARVQAQVEKDEAKKKLAAQRSSNTYLASTGKADERNAASRSKAAANLAALNSGQALADLSHRNGRALLDELRKQGYVFSSEQTQGIGRGGRNVRSEIFTGTKEEGGQILTRKLRFNWEGGKAAGAEVKELSRAMRETRNEAGLLGGDFIRNTAKVMTWAASVRVMESATRSLAFSLQSLVDIGPQMARLDQTFKGVGGNSHQLTMDILGLAAAEGRSREEAMESAIAWARLGLSRVQVIEAVRSSLMAANIAQMSAGEATEHLSAIYNAYGLQVGQLRSKLSELNAIALSYNVTNADMLEGLSRSSAVAKQAKIPLTELAALIGATVGATGQSGANVGNALKTFISKLASPDMQQRLHNQFRFEVRTNGGNEIKDMSQVLADLYVRYQKMSDAQRQSLLYQTAGANQTSRITALLDNYIRAQTLAIVAQLNLNSAETENAKVRATLKAQLQGIVTEWERLVNIQANKGVITPMSMMSESAQALRNSLKLMNTGVGSTGLSLMLPLFAALGARLVMTKIAMEQTAGRSNLLVRSFQRIRTTGLELSATLSKVVSDFYGASRSGNGLDRRLGDVAMGMTDWGQRRKAYARLLRSNMEPTAMATLVPNAAIAGWATLNSLMGKTARLIAGIAVAARSFFSFGVGMVAIGASMWAFNRAMDAIGASSERAEERMAGFNAEAEKAGEAANAAGQAFKLFETAERALPNMNKLGDRKKLWDQISTVAFPDEVNASRKPKTDAFRKEGLAMLERENGLERASAMLQERKLAMIREQQIQRQLNFEAMEKESKATEEEIVRLKRLAASGAFWVSESKIKELESKSESLKGKKTENLAAQASADNDYDAVLEGDQLHLSNLEKTKTALQAISELYKGMSTVSPAQQYTVDMARTKSELEWIKAWRTQLRESEMGNYDKRAAEEMQLRGIEESIRQKRTERMTLQNQINASIAQTDSLYGTGASASDLEKAGKLDDEIARLEAEKATVSQNRTTLNIRNRKLDETLRQQEQQKTAELEAMESTGYANMVETRTRMEVSRQNAGNQVESANYGVNAGDRLRRQFEKAQDVYKSNRQIAEDVNTSAPDRERALAAAQEALVQQGKLRLEMQRELVKLSAEEKQLMIDKTREFQRSLLNAGPGELLRKMAAYRMTGNGKQDPKDGAFFAMSPEMRGDVFGLRPNMDPQVQILKRAQEVLMPMLQGGVQAMEDAMISGATEMRTLFGQMAQILRPTELLDSSAKASMAIAELAEQSGAAAAALETFSGYVKQIGDYIGGIKPAQQFAAPQPVNPQIGGTGGAMGMQTWQNRY